MALGKRLINMIKEMVSADLNKAKSYKLLKDHGYQDNLISED